MRILMPTTAHDWQLAFELADEALDLSPAERVSWFAQIAPEKAHLKALLSDLLAEGGDTKSNNFLSRLPRFTTLPVLPASPREPDPFISPTKSATTLCRLATGVAIGPYTLIRELGTGGMGAVWLAERAYGLANGKHGAATQKVALKIPYMGPSQHQLAARFLRERDILAALTHPNIARLYDAGSTADGQAYLAMEVVEGTSLIDYCDKNNLGIEQRLRLFRQVLSAVQFAHANLVLHRDLKPSNILVTERGQVSLLDFGIAKFMRPDMIVGDAAAAPTAAALTEFGRTAYTPDYASPEQLANQPLSTASDVYALGIVLYELLAGVRPYKLKRGTRGELEEAILAAEAPPLFDRIERACRENVAAKRGVSISKLESALTSDLNTLVQKAIKKIPAQRYASAEAFLADIDRYLAHEPIHAQRESLWYVAKKFMARNRLPVISGGLVVMSLLFGVVATTWQAREASLQRDEALMEAKTSTAYRNYMRLIMTNTGANQRAFTMEELLSEARVKIEKNYAQKPALGSNVLQQIAQHFIELGLIQKGAATALAAFEMAERSNDARTLVQSLCVLGEAELSLGRLADARARMVKAGVILASVTGASMETRARCLRLESAIALRDANPDLAVAKAQAGLALIENEDADDLAMTSALSHLSHVLTTSGKPREAYQVGLRMMKFLEARGLEYTSTGLGERNNLNMAQVAMGEFLSASSGLKKMVMSYENAPQNNARENAIDPVPPYLLGNYGEVLRRLGRYDEAARWLQRAADASVSAGAQQHEAIARIRQSLTASKLHKLDEAAAHLASAGVLVDKSEPPDKMTVMRAWFVAAEATLAHERGDTPHARKMLEKALTELGFPEQHSRPGMRYLLLIAADLAIDARDNEAAAPYIQALLNNTRLAAREPLTSADLGLAELLNARLAIARGEMAKARASLNIAIAATEHGLGSSHPHTQEARTLLEQMPNEIR
jgi:eukaryotic-like serine/threonine-protein kinase